MLTCIDSKIDPSTPKLDSTQVTSSTSDTEKPFTIFGLNPKDPNDWITVGLSIVVVWNGVQIVGELFEAAMKKLPQ